MPAGILATLLFVLAFVIDHNRAHAAAAAGPLDDTSVSPLVSLDNAVEAVASRVTPAVVNVAVTSRVSPGDKPMTRAKASGGQALAASTRKIFRPDSAISSSAWARMASR